ncbi:MAG: hypothetical protein WC379_14330 [Methanoregula sp.]
MTGKNPDSRRTRTRYKIPLAICDTCTENPSIMFLQTYWTIGIMRVQSLPIS